MWNDPMSRHSVMSSLSRRCSSCTSRIGWMGTPFIAAARSANCCAVAGNLAEQRRRPPTALSVRPGRPARAAWRRCRPVNSSCGPIVLVDVRGSGIDVDERPLASLVPEARFVFDRVVADGDDHIGCVEELVGGLVVEQADAAAEAVEELARHDSGPLVRADHRQFRLGQEGRARLQRRAAGSRAGRAARRAAPRRLISAAAAAIALGVSGAEHRSGETGVSTSPSAAPDHDVLRRADERGPGPPGLRGAEGVRHHFRNRLRGIDLGAELGDGPEQAHGIHALMDLLQSVGERHGAADRDDGIAFRVRGGEAGHQVGAARAGRDQRHARLAGHAADPAGDEGGVLLVAADDRLDPRVQQRVEHLVDLRAGDAEDVLDALRLQTLHQQFAPRSAGSGCLRIVLISFSFCFGKIRARIAAQVGLQEILGFGQRDVIIALALDLQTQVGPAALEQMAAAACDRPTRSAGDSQAR